MNATDVKGEHPYQTARSADWSFTNTGVIIEFRDAAMAKNVSVSRPLCFNVPSEFVKVLNEDFDDLLA